MKQHDGSSSRDGGGPTEVLVDTATIRMNVRDAGRGPAILLCHGFPETSYACRHQVAALAAGGYRVIAPDMRGYGGTEVPEGVDQYTVFHLVGDMVALLDALGEQSALIVGSDWGATVAWQASQMRPDRFAGVMALGVPLMGRPPRAPTRIFPQTATEQHYTLYFQQVGAAEAEFERDVRRTLRKLYFAASGDAGPRETDPEVPNPFAMVSRREGLLAPLPEPEEMPAWLNEAELEAFVEAFSRSGFRGGLNYYRNLDRNWELQASLAGRTIEVPAKFVAGERDTGLQIPGMMEIIRAMPTLAPRIYEPLFLKGAGHWLAQERADQVSEAILGFAKEVFATRARHRER